MKLLEEDIEKIKRKLYEMTQGIGDILYWDLVQKDVLDFKCHFDCLGYCLEDIKKIIK